MLTTAGRTRFTTAEYPRPEAASERVRHFDGRRRILERNCPSVAARNP